MQQNITGLLVYAHWTLVELLSTSFSPLSCTCTFSIPTSTIFAWYVTDSNSILWILSTAAYSLYRLYMFENDNTKEMKWSVTKQKRQKEIIWNNMKRNRLFSIMSYLYGVTTVHHLKKLVRFRKGQDVMISKVSIDSHSADTKGQSSLEDLSSFMYNVSGFSWWVHVLKPVLSGVRWTILRLWPGVMPSRESVAFFQLIIEWG